MRFVATSDWQLGMPAHFLPDEARARFQQARIDVITQIGRVATDNDAAAILVAGDVFDSNFLDRGIVARTLDALEQVETPVYLLPGNHDPLDITSIYHHSAFLAGCPDHVHVVRDTRPIELAPGLELLGVPWHTKFPSSDLVAQALASAGKPAEGVFRVLGAHGAETTLSPDAMDPSVIHTGQLSDAIAQGVVDFAVLGDRHSTTEVAERIWYPGAPEVTHRRETKPGNVLVIDTDHPREPHVVRVGQWDFATITEDLNSLADVEQFNAELLSHDNKSRTALWLALSGTLTPAAAARLEQVVADSELVYASVNQWQRHTDLAVIADDEDFADLGLSGFAREAVANLISAGDQEASDALRLLYRLVEADA